MIVIVDSDIRIKNPSKELLEWSANNLTFNNSEYHRKLAMGFYVGNIPKEYMLYERIDGDLVLPYGCGSYITPMIIKDAKIISNLVKGKNITMKGSVPLYDYQAEAIQPLIKGRNGLLISPAGSGKTQIGIALIKEIGLKALWITHTADLLKQSRDRAKEYLKGDFGTITDGKINIGADITFSTIQTLVNIDLDKYKNEWDVIIVDEAHRVAGSPTKVMMFYKVLNSLSARHKYGLTATYERQGMKNFRNSTQFILGDILHEIPQSKVDEKIIKAEIKPLFLDTPLSEKLMDTDGVVNYTKLISYLVNNKKRNQEIVKHLKNSKDEYNIILSGRVEHLEVLCEMLGEGEVLVGKTPKKKRDEIIERAKAGEIRYIFSTFSLAKEGLDIPILSRLHLVTPIKDKISVVQSKGRIERNFEGKRKPVVYDYVDVAIPHLVNYYKVRQRHYKK